MKFKEKVLIFATIIVYLVCGYLSVNNLNLYTPDSTRYYIWTQSLSNFEGFKDNTLPEPKRYVIHAPFYSLLMSPVAFIFPGNLIAIKLATIFVAGFGLFLFFKFLKRYFDTDVAIYGTILLLINPLFFLLSGELLSDVPFLVIIIGIFLYSQKINELKTVSNSNIIAFALLVSITVLLREVGIALMISVVLFFFIRRKFQIAITTMIISLAFYLLWIFRNEFLVANFELPDLTNSKILTYHFFTNSEASLLVEFTARIKHNFITYFSKVVALIFYPIYESTQYDVIFRKEGIIAEVSDLLKIFKIPFAILIWALTVYGFRKFQKASGIYLLITLFILFYSLIILIYPINDIRFLLPLLPIFILYFLTGTKHFLETLYRKYKNSLFKFASLLLGLFFLVPNFVWTGEFIYLSNRYMSSPMEFQKYLEGKKYPPSHFTKPLNLAGEWINANSKPDAVVYGMWKDLACWIGTRKLIISDYLISPVEFDYKIRDYNVDFLVSHADRLGFDEFEVQISQSKKFKFKLENKFGRLNIYRVSNLDEILPLEPKTEFQKAIYELFNCNFIEAESILDSLYIGNPLNAKVIFYNGIVKSFLGKFTDAEKYFKTLEGFSQAGMFLNEINLYRRLNQMIQFSRTHPEQFADYTTRLAGSYWSLGYEKYSYNLLDTVLRFDSSFIPAYIFKIHFALKQNKLEDARSALNKLSKLDTANTLLGIYNNLITRTESIRKYDEKHILANVYYLNAKDYYTLGVYEDAIDNLLLCLRYDENNTDAMMLLSDIYILKRRFAPAKKYLEQIIKLNPNNYSIKEKYESLLKYF